MRTAHCSLVLVGALVASACRPTSGKDKPASKESAVMVDAAPAPPAPTASVTTATSSADASRIELTDANLRAWIDARVVSSTEGKPQRVRIPLVHHSDGWGCVCPPYYVGDSPVSAQGPWLDPTFSKGARPLRVGERAFAEGVFGAPTKHVSYPGGPPPTGSWEYDLIPFTVTKIFPIPEDTDSVLLERL